MPHAWQSRQKIRKNGAQDVWSQAAYMKRLDTLIKCKTMVD